MGFTVHLGNPIEYVAQRFIGSNLGIESVDESLNVRATQKIRFFIHKIRQREWLNKHSMTHRLIQDIYFFNSREFK